MKQSWLSVVLLAVAVVLVNVCAQETSNQNTTSTPKTNATYWVTASNKFWIGRPMQLLVQILSGVDPVSVTVSITTQGYEYNSTAQTLVTSAATDVYPGEPQTLQIDVPLSIKVPEDSWSRMYKILVVGQGTTVNFKHEDYIYLQSKSFSIYVVTDKGIYRPGQTVKFRVLALFLENLKVLQDAKDIYIKDAKGNIIRQYLGVTGTAGVVDGSFSLADSTPTGDWTISATVRDQKQEKTFTVDDYVLPKFEVTVTPPAIPLSSDTNFPITVKAKYTFGQPVTDGDVQIRITRSYYYSSQVQSGWQKKGKLNSDGEVTFQITSKELVSVAVAANNYYYNLLYEQFLVEANVTEGSTQQLQAGSATMQMYASPYSMQIVPITAASYKPGMPYSAYVEVKKPDGTSLSQEDLNNLRVNFNVTYEVLIPPEDQETTPAPNDSDSSNSSFGKINLIRFPYRPTITKVLELDNNVRTLSELGFANISLFMPSEAVSTSLVAALNEPYNSTTAYSYATPFQSPSNTFLQLSAPLQTPKVGDTITLKVTSTEPVKNLKYQVLSKGGLVGNGTVLSSTIEGSMTLSFDIKITQAMVPSITIVAFYVREQDSEIVPDAVSLSVNGLFQKSVSVEFDRDKVKPGEPFNMIIKAEPESTVFTQAIDKSVYLLKSGNKLTQDMVRDDLAEYSYGGSYPWARYMFICGWPSVNSGKTAGSVFQEAGIYLFTNGLLQKEQGYTFSDTSDKLAMASAGAPGAVKGPPPSSDFKPAERVRKNFPETWIWGIVPMTTDSNGEIEIPVTAPDTITSFQASVFSVHPTYGLSVGKDVATVTVFRELFVSLDLSPYILRYEDYCFVASVFSYFPGDIPVFLKFDSSDQFNGSYVKRQGDAVTVVKEKMSFTDFFPSITENEVKSSRFCFTPIVTGDIKLSISALSREPGLSDAVEQVISVRPEGVARSNNHPFLVNLTSSFWHEQVNITYPPETVADSQKLTISFAGNIMGQILANTQNLLREPYGCGEQNMLNFAPSVSLLNFFLAIGTATPEIIQRAIDYILKGYQTELTYEHKTGGFSAFGEQDKNASQWLTAFVVSCFAQASILNDANDNILGIDTTEAVSRSAKFLMSNQNDNGSFTEHGIVFHSEMQGGSAEGEALTAYVLISLAEAAQTIKTNSSLVSEIQDSVNLATKYLADRVDLLQDPFDICIVSYVLHLVNHTRKDAVFAKMEAIAQTGDGQKFWKRQNSPQEKYAVYPWSSKADGMSNEMTAYALKVYAVRGIDASGGLPIVRFLTNQQGSNGGFVATQDTVIGLQALTTVIAKLYQPGDYSVTLTVSYIDGDGQSRQEIVHINKTTEMLLQKVYIEYKNNAPSFITLTANTDDGRPGPSTVLADVSLDYNVKGESLAICYNTSHNVVKTDGTMTLTIDISAVTNDATSMSILKVQIPAGYSVSLEELAENDNVSRVDPYDGDKVVIYYDSGVITEEGIRATIKMHRTNDAITDAKPRSYTISDYYQTNCVHTSTYTWNRDHICAAVPDSGICRYVGKDVPEVTSQ